MKANYKSGNRVTISDHNGVPYHGLNGEIVGVSARGWGDDTADIYIVLLDAESADELYGRICDRVDALEYEGIARDIVDFGIYRALCVSEKYLTRL